MELDEEGSLAYYVQLGLPERAAHALVLLRRDQSGGMSYREEREYWKEGERSERT